MEIKNEIIEDIIKNLKDAENLKDELFDFDYKFSTVYHVKKEFSEAVYMVVKNAVKAVKPISDNDKISIKVKTCFKDHIEINISDTGCGIPPDKHTAIFNFGTSFWSDKKAENEGIGLWLVRIIVESFGGTIELVESAVGRGTAFAIKLPVTYKSESHKKEMPATENPVRILHLSDLHITPDTDLEYILQPFFC